MCDGTQKIAGMACAGFHVVDGDGWINIHIYEYMYIIAPSIPENVANRG